MVDRMELTPATQAHMPAGGPGLDSVLGTDRGARVTGVARDHGAALAELKARMNSATSCSRLSDYTAVPVDPAQPGANSTPGPTPATPRWAKMRS